MCGIAGFADTSRRMDGDALLAMATRMGETIVHRGPDDQGAWVDAETGTALASRRLAIVDLSPAGHQPMHSACGRYVIVFNGEIYNFQCLRAELEGDGRAPHFRGHSDTEVMLAAICRWGLKSAVKRFNGMFAFALWDRQERVLHLLRDRLGEKPLYYGWMGKTFLFASELKAMRVHPEFRGEIDRGVLALYLRHNYVPSPYSIYKGVYKLPPGCMLSLGLEALAGSASFSPFPAGDASSGQVRPARYWSAREAAERGVANPFRGSTQEAVEELEKLLRDAIRMRMVADVPLGACLSGGIDSSMVVALMQAESDRPVKTFTIGFYEDAYNEAHYARAVAQYLGTDHTDLYLTTDQAQAVIPRLAMLYDEPFADSSQIPTFLVSELARREVTVSLSGDGGDELFGGYDRYFIVQNILKQFARAPKIFRTGASAAIRSVSPAVLSAVFAALSPLLPRKFAQPHPGQSLHRLAEILRNDSLESMYRCLVSQWQHPGSLLGGTQELPTTLTDPAEWARLPDPLFQMLYFDTVTYLPDDILVKVDRASMAVSLEARVPLLDHRVVEFAWQLPFSLKIRDHQGKWVLRQILHKYVPEKLVERPKKGFGVPIGQWLRTSLRDWAESLLDEKRLRRQGVLDPAPIRTKWAEHLSGRQNWEYAIWTVLMFQAWLDATATQ